MKKVESHELENHICYDSNGKHTGSSYFLYVKYYDGYGCVFTIENEIDDSEFPSIEIYASESFSETAKKWNEICKMEY